MLTVDVLRTPTAGSTLHDVLVTIASDDPAGFDHVMLTDRAMVPLAPGIDLGSCVKRFEYTFRGIAAERFPVSGVVRECANGATTPFGPLLGRETQRDGSVRPPCRGTPEPTYSFRSAPIPPTPQCSAALTGLEEFRTAILLACQDRSAAEHNRTLWAVALGVAVVAAATLWILAAIFPLASVGFAVAALVVSGIVVGLTVAVAVAQNAIYVANGQLTRLRSRYGGAADMVRLSCCAEDYDPSRLEPPSC